MDSKYSFYLGTARGTLLHTSCAPNEKIQYDKPEEPSEVTALAFGRSEDEIVVGYENGNVSLYSSAQNKYVKTLKNIDGSDSIAGIGCVEKSIIIGNRDGVINVWNGKKNDSFSINLEEKGTLDCMVFNNSRDNVIGTGGEYNDFKLWNIETKQCIFKAKSLGHDELNLQIPTTIRGITFFSVDENLSACVTKEGHVLFYDDRAQRKPITKYYEKKASFTTIACAYRERECMVGTTRGYMQLLDLRSNKCLKTFTSFTGSVTSISCDPLEPYVASTSLDRHLRIHNLETKEVVHKVYMKQNLTRMLMKPIVKEEPEEKVSDTGGVVDEEYEEIFNNMETIDEAKKVNKSKKKNLDVTDNSEGKKQKRKCVGERPTKSKKKKHKSVV